MRGQIRGLKQAQRNAQDGFSLIQTAEGALQEVHAILQRMRELAVQASNDTNTLDDRREIQKEINQLLEEIDRIADNTEFNTQKLLDGTFQDKQIHIGANATQSLEIDISSMKTTAIGYTDGSGTTTISTLKVDVDSASTGGVLTNSDADKAITFIQGAIDMVSAERSKLGAYQNRLEHTIANLGTAAENLAAAESRIRDVDMAAEMMEFTKNQLLQQAGVAMLAQANMAPQAVLQLLR